MRDTLNTQIGNPYTILPSVGGEGGGENGVGGARGGGGGLGTASIFKLDTVIQGMLPGGGKSQPQYSNWIP